MKDTPFWAVGYVLIFLAMQVTAHTLVLAVSRFLGVGAVGGSDAVFTLIALVLSSLAAICLFAWARWSPLSRSYVSSRPWAALLWSAVAAAGGVLPSLYVQDMLPAWPEPVQSYVDEAEALASQLLCTRGGYAVVCLLVPVAEEMVFRGAALRTLLAWSPGHRWAMIALSALLFALAHLNPAQMLHPFVFGLLLGWMYERTGSVLPGIVFHWANNTAAYLLFHAYPMPAVTLTDIFGHGVRPLLAVLFSLCILVPSIVQLNVNMKRPV